MRLNEIAAEVHRRMCEDDRFGYSWEERYGAIWETWTIDGKDYRIRVGDYDCSSSTITAWAVALQHTPWEGALDGAITTTGRSTRSRARTLRPRGRGSSTRGRRGCCSAPSSAPRSRPCPRTAGRGSGSSPPWSSRTHVGAMARARRRWHRSLAWELSGSKASSSRRPQAHPVIGTPRMPRRATLCSPFAPALPLRHNPLQEQRAHVVDDAPQ